ncbi:MAG: hypothetical protein WBD30_16880, partial [Bacteroidota bacterium]
MNCLRGSFLIISSMLVCASVVSAQGSDNGVAVPLEADGLDFVQEPEDTKGGAIISPAVTVQLKDRDNDVRESGVPITITIYSGTGTLSGTRTRTTNSQGLATFDDLSI